MFKSITSSYLDSISPEFECGVIGQPFPASFVKLNAVFYLLLTSFSTALQIKQAQHSPVSLATHSLSDAIFFFRALKEQNSKRK